jgi:heat shock protein HspQ
MEKIRIAKYKIGQVVKHRLYPFRGVVFDIDPEFDNTDEWYDSIPADVRPRKDQPFYHLYAENAETEYVAYVSEQNLLPDTSDKPLRHPQISEVFVQDDNGGYRPRYSQMNQCFGALQSKGILKTFAPQALFYFLRSQIVLLCKSLQTRLLRNRTGPPQRQENQALEILARRNAPVQLRRPL